MLQFSYQKDLYLKQISFWKVAASSSEDLYNSQWFVGGNLCQNLPSLSSTYKVQETDELSPLQPHPPDPYLDKMH